MSELPNISQIHKAQRDSNQPEDEDRSMFDSTWCPIIAEFVGVTLFVFVGCLAVNSGNEPGGDVTDVALGHGLTITLLIMGLGEISGGHFNPAVTLGVVLVKAIPPRLALGYIVGQIMGGVLGAALVRGVLPHANYALISGGTHQLGPGVEPGWAVLLETIFTTVLVFTVLMVAVDKHTKSNLAPLAIGLAVAVDILAGGELTGASMNPARALGPAVAASDVLDNAWNHHYVYWVGPVLGSSLAFLLYKFLFSSPSVRWISRRDTVPSLSVQMDGHQIEDAEASINHM